MSESLLTNPATKWHLQSVVAQLRVCGFSVQRVLGQMIGYKRRDPIFNGYLQAIIKDVSNFKCRMLFPLLQQIHSHSTFCSHSNINFVKICDTLHYLAKKGQIILNYAIHYFIIIIIIIQDLETFNCI